MSQGLVQTKRRMKSVLSTKKITNAMKLVASAKLKRYKNIMLESKEYSEALISLTQDVFSKVDSIKSPYLIENEVEKKLYIIITSTLGLCGGYNYNIFKFADSQIKENDDVIIIGQKGAHHYKHLVKYINFDYIDLGTNVDEKIVKQLCEMILKQYTNREYRSIHLIYTKFINSLTFVPENLTLLPLKIDKKEINDGVNGVIMEPSPKEIVSSLIPFYLKSTVYSKLLESIVSEQASRRTAMENASNNADEIYQELQIEYNKERQAQITQEITEVVGGANK